ncbi:MAG: DUF1566 domain-containing protein [Mangrovibacterium sp.]
MINRLSAFTLPFGGVGGGFGLLFLLLLPFGSMAQKVSLGENGHLILHLDRANGMPENSYTTRSTTSWIGNQVPSNSAWLSSEYNQSGGIVNAAVFRKIEVAPRDLTATSGAITASAVRKGMYWADAVNACRNLEYDGHSDWRLPTQKELLLIYVLQPVISTFFDESNSDEKFYDSDTDANHGYWCLTEQTASNAWRIYFKNGGCWNSPKNTAYYVRCVREM